MFDQTVTAVVQRLGAAARAESQAAGQRLAAIGELDVLWLRRFGERETWCTDTQEAITAELAAALNITQALAASHLYYSRAMRLRLARVGERLLAGDIDYRTFQTIVYRTDLISDPEVMATLDAELALSVPRWPAMTRGRLAARVDQMVARVDRDAVRRRRERHADRELSIFDHTDGLTEVFGRLYSTDAHAVDARLDALAAAVCAADPRTRNQRRADAMGALAASADRLGCRCGQPDCPTAAAPPPSPVVIHVVAEAASLDGAAPRPGAMIGADALIPAELIAELAKSAKLRPLVHPADAPPEAGYLPSQALADFVHCRDLTCRFPGCGRPALSCDIDHTVAHADGGPTHASNLKSLCRLHHLLKTFWGLARPTTNRRHPDLDIAVGTDVRHHPRQRAAVLRPVRTHRHARPHPPPATLRRPHREDAPTPAHPRPQPRQLHRRPTPTESQSTPSSIRRTCTTPYRPRPTTVLIQLALNGLTVDGWPGPATPTPARVRYRCTRPPTARSPGSGCPAARSLLPSSRRWPRRPIVWDPELWS